ncbi:MAG TPA: riboflavin kinase, partial [Bacteroidia bacterium]|nr:riboflavin kinase [Bacteroidia bacterium]
VIDEVAVSSTKIRKALQVGDVEAANKLLGHEFTLHGEVIKGDKIGTSLGFPTANIRIQESYKLIPDDGIYAVLVEVDKVIHKGMLYLGTRPTVDGKKHTSEVNILDFNKDIYGKSITVYLKTRIRGDMHFENLEQLKEKMKEDLRNATKLLS